MGRTKAPSQGDRSDIEEKKKKIAELLKKAKGEDRSFSEYARSAGVSVASISRIRKGDYIPSPQIMKSLTSEDAAPRGGVTYEDFMDAAGYHVRAPLNFDYLVTLPDSDEKLLIEMETVDRESRVNAASDVIRAYGNKVLEQSVVFCVISTLFERGILFRKSVNSNPSSFDLELEILEGPIGRWSFDVAFVPENAELTGYWLISRLSRYLLREEDASEKISLVIGNKRLFEHLQRYEYCINYRGELSLIYYDVKSQKLTSEFYLSNYCSGDHSKEIYITDIQK